MDAVLRSLAVFAFLLVLFRVTGKRSLAQITVFDFVLLLILAEATQQALLGNDFSVTNAFIIVVTLWGADTLLQVISGRWPRTSKALDGVPLLLVEDGEPHLERMRRERVQLDDVLESARKSHGLERLAEVKHAILERDGGISIIPVADVLRRTRDAE